jgi:hypothetical protein
MSTGTDRPRAARPSRGSLAVRALLLALLVLSAVAPTLLHPSVQNRTPHPLWVRPEYGARPVALPPASRFGGIDALADPVDHPGRIFRSCDYCSVIVEADGRVKVLCSGLAANTCQLWRGGWKDRAWQRYQQSAYYDHDWDPLFARAGAATSLRR